MSALVETMMYVREKPWHGLGVCVEEAPNSTDALKLAGLDWTVRSEDVLSIRGDVIPDYKANVRDSDDTVLGIVGNRYKIVQNTDAFAFTDALIGGDVRYETAGSLKGGRQIWLLARMPERDIAGDVVEPYLCFSNTHDGSGALRICMTPIRVICNNTLNLALDTAKRSWAIKHTENIESRMQEAHDCLFLANSYMDNLTEYADAAKKIKLSDDALKSYLDELFPVLGEPTERKVRNSREAKDAFMVCYYAPDIVKFQGTAWGALNAMADFVGHAQPHSNRKTYAENNWGRIMDGHVLMDKMTALCMG